MLYESGHLPFALVRQIHACKSWMLLQKGQQRLLQVPWRLWEQLEPERQCHHVLGLARVPLIRKGLQRGIIAQLQRVFIQVSSANFHQAAEFANLIEL